MRRLLIGAALLAALAHDRGGARRRQPPDHREGPWGRQHLARLHVPHRTARRCRRREGDGSAGRELRLALSPSGRGGRRQVRNAHALRQRRPVLHPAALLGGTGLRRAPTPCPSRAQRGPQARRGLRHVPRPEARPQPRRARGEPGQLSFLGTRARPPFATRSPGRQAGAPLRCLRISSNCSSPGASEVPGPYRRSRARCADATASRARRSTGSPWARAFRAWRCAPSRSTAGRERSLSMHSSG